MPSESNPLWNIRVTAGNTRQREVVADLEVSAPNQTTAVLGVQAWAQSAHGIQKMNMILPDRTYFAIHAE